MDKKKNMPDSNGLYISYSRDDQLKYIAIRRKLAEKDVPVHTDAAMHLVNLLSFLLEVARGAPGPKESHTVPFKQLSALTDWVPSAKLRKKQRKLLADEMAEIVEFRQQGRYLLARWRVLWTWVHWLRYLMTTPFVAAVKALRKIATN